MVGFLRNFASRIELVGGWSDQRHADGDRFRELHSSSERQLASDCNQGPKHHRRRASIGNHDDVTPEWDDRDSIQSDTRGERRNGQLFVVGLFRIFASRIELVGGRSDQWHADVGRFRELHGSGEGQLANDCNQGSKHRRRSASIGNHDDVTPEWDGGDSIQPDTRGQRRNGRIRVVGLFRIFASGIEFISRRGDQRHANGSGFRKLHGSGEGQLANNGDQSAKHHRGSAPIGDHDNVAPERKGRDCIQPDARG